MGIYQTFAVDGVSTGGMMNKMPGMPTAFWGYYFNVDGLDAAVERVTANGGQISNGPMEVPGGQWIVNCVDPQGAHFSLWRTAGNCKAGANFRCPYRSRLNKLRRSKRLRE